MAIAHKQVEQIFLNPPNWKASPLDVIVESNKLSNLNHHWKDFQEFSNASVQILMQYNSQENEKTYRACVPSQYLTTELTLAA